MAKALISKFEINGNSYTINAIKKGNGFLVNINNKIQKTVKKIVPWDNSADFSSIIDKHKVAARISNKKIRISIDGFYLDNNKPFVPLSPVPKWGNIFIILNMFNLDAFRMTAASISPFAAALCGAIGAAVFMLANLLCLRIARSNSDTSVKVMLCSISTIAAWLLNLFFCEFVSVLI